MSAPILATAKVFTTGRSQAVRLPKEFRFNTKEVTIERQGDAVILRPRADSQDAWWNQMEVAMDGLRGVLAPIERDRTPPTDDDTPMFD
jgi:antitoxin VapB